MKRSKNMVSTHDAKTHLSRLLKRVGAGEQFVISRGNEPIARLVPYESAPKKRILGRFRERIYIADDFDQALPATILEDFEK